MSFVIRILALAVLVGVVYSQTAKAIFQPFQGDFYFWNGETIKEGITLEAIDEAVRLEFITEDEAVTVRQDIKDGNRTIIDLNEHDGYIAFGYITYDSVDDPILDEWYDEYH